MRIGKVEASCLTPESVSEIELWLADNPVDCLYFLADSDPETMRLAAESGFRFVDARVTLEANVPEYAIAPIPEIRPARAEDLPGLRRIAAESHHDTRFYVDGGFPTEACDELYRLWISKDFNESGVVLVAEYDNHPVGYISLYENAGKGHIALMAVDAAYRRCHLGAKLSESAFIWFRLRGASHVEVPTQAANIPALRLYEKCGFMIKAIQFWHHRWQPRAA